jgi:hypothetical protein
MSLRVRLGTLVGAELLLLAGLHRLARVQGFSIDWQQPVRWLGDTSAEDVAAALVLLGALVLAYWLVLSTIAGAVAVLSGREVLAAAAHRLSPPLVRRLVSRMMALSMAASSLAGPLVPALANGPGEALVWDVGEAPAEGDQEPRDRLILPPHLLVVPDPDAESEGVDSPTEPGEPPGTVTVTRGDHLWSLSEQHLQRVWGRDDLEDHEVARYWVQVIDLNRARLRSGNPDLIYPGEVVLLPEVSSSL